MWEILRYFIHPKIQATHFKSYISNILSSSSRGNSFVYFNYSKSQVTNFKSYFFNEVEEDENEDQHLPKEKSKSDQLFNKILLV